MAWTAQLTKAETNTVNANVTITLQFTSDGGEVQTRDIPSVDWTDEQIAIRAQLIIVTLETRDATLAALKARIGSGPSPVSLPRDGFPTPNADAQTAVLAQSARIVELAQKISQLNTLQAAATAGLIPTDDPDLVASQSEVKASSSTASTTATAQPASP